MTEIKPYPVDQSYLTQKEPKAEIILEDGSKYDIVKATQFGILSRVMELIESGYNVNKMDSENVSLLHWAAINNRQDIVRYFLSKGAVIDIVGGDLKSTPLHWSVRQGLLDMVSLLLSAGADPLVVDGQGLTCIHVAAQLAYTHIVAYLLAYGVPVNILDSHGMTALMWSAARSNSADPARLLITWGSNVNLQDSSGCTSGHYAAMAGNFMVICLLDKANIDWNLINKVGLTVHQALIKKNMTWVANRLTEMMVARGLTRHKNFFYDFIASNKNFRFAMMVSMPPIVFFLLGIILHFSLNYWIKVILLITIFLSVRFGMRPFVDSRVQVLSMFSLATATTFFLCVTYIFFLLPYNTVVINTSFIISISLLWYNFIQATVKDPGFIKIDPSQRVRSILAMTSHDPATKVTLDRFCTTCLIRKPLRSKHCSVCDRCVARFDHHCPWIYNCVGINTIKHFILYLAALFPSLTLFAYGAICFWCHFHIVDMKDTLSLAIYKFIVDIFHLHPWILFCTINSLVYLFWITLLLGSQLYQAIWLNLTTNERINWDRLPTVTVPQDTEGQQKCKDKCSHSDNKSSSPYYMGLMKNLQDIFQSKRFSIDWHSVYTLDAFNDRTHHSWHDYQHI